MTLYLETADGFTPWAGEAIAEILHPISIETLWTDAELAAVGLYRPADADAVPDGKIIASTSVQRVAGVVRYVDVLADAPAPVVTPSVPYLYAVANLQVADQDVSGIETSVNFSAAMWLDVGQYLLFFSESQANVQFMAKAYSGSCQALIVEKTEDYLSITAADSSGAFDPAEFSVEVIRISNNG